MTQGAGDRKGFLFTPPFSFFFLFFCYIGEGKGNNGVVLYSQTSEDDFLDTDTKSQSVSNWKFTLGLVERIYSVKF